MQKFKRILFILLILPKALVAMSLAAVLMTFSFVLTTLIDIATVVNDTGLSAIEKLTNIIRQITDNAENI
mgnify:FL=1